MGTGEDITGSFHFETAVTNQSILSALDLEYDPMVPLNPLRRNIERPADQRGALGTGMKANTGTGRSVGMQIPRASVGTGEDITGSFHFETAVTNQSILSALDLEYDPMVPLNPLRRNIERPAGQPKLWDAFCALPHNFGCHQPRLRA
jgi:hypothetical protein